MKRFEELEEYERDELCAGCTAGEQMGRIFGFGAGMISASIILAISPLEMSGLALLVRCGVTVVTFMVVGSVIGYVIANRKERALIESGYYKDPMNRSKYSETLQRLRALQRAMQQHQSNK